MSVGGRQGGGISGVGMSIGRSQRGGISGGPRRGFCRDFCVGVGLCRGLNSADVIEVGQALAACDCAEIQPSRIEVKPQVATDRTARVVPDSSNIQACDGAACREGLLESSGEVVVLIVVDEMAGGRVSSAQLGK